MAMDPPMKTPSCSALIYLLTWLLLAPTQVIGAAVGATSVNSGQPSSTTFRTGTSSISCFFTLTSTLTTTVPSTTTLVYQIDSGYPVLRVTTTNDAVPQLTPTTVYRSTVFTTAATSTSTILYTPTSVVGNFRTYTVPSPSGFRPIIDTLPNTKVGETQVKRALGLGPLCFATTTVMKTVLVTSTTVTATSVTTLTGEEYIFEPFSTTVDDYGLRQITSTFYPTYRGYHTVYALTPRTVTTSFGTTVFTTVTLPTQTVTGTTTTVYQACGERNRNYGAYKANQLADPSKLWVMTAPTDIPADLSTEDGCCRAAFDHGGVAYFQSDNGRCRVWRVAENNMCVQSANNITGEVVPVGGTLPAVAYYTGNGVCGQIVDVKDYSPAPSPSQ
jgi:hypothetical protein